MTARKGFLIFATFTLALIACTVAADHHECKETDDCGDKEFCKKKDGECDSKGMCAERPELCPEIFDPVCGCDGMTYSNSCFAAMGGTSVAHKGECKGTACASNEDCGKGEFCFRPAGHCDSEKGKCEDRPQACFQIFDPVCGCDGKTYSNSCFAAMAGVNVKHQGACKS